ERACVVGGCPAVSQGGAAPERRPPRQQNSSVGKKPGRTPLQVSEYLVSRQAPGSGGRLVHVAVVAVPGNQDPTVRQQNPWTQAKAHHHRSRGLPTVRRRIVE